MRIDSNTTIKLGDRNIVKIKRGDVVIWEKNTVDYFYIENTYAGENTITFTTKKEYRPTSDEYSNQVEYSTDKRNWSIITFDTTTPQTVTISEGEKLYLRNDSGFFNYRWGNDKYMTTINTSQKCKVGGNINTLLNYNEEIVDISGKYGCFSNLFYNATNITDVSNLVMPATTLERFCYYSMFSGCKSLVNAPSLPATTLAESCYQYMFSSCTSITTAPELPATTLASNCYVSMFSSCTSLTTAPALPATKLASYCYQYMFRGCSNLVNPPELPATTLTKNCYEYMFDECKSLVTAPSLPATKLAESCYSNMFSYSPLLASAPELPATELAKKCYYAMFSGCSSLVNAPSLPATTLATGCYQYMFLGCSKLKSVTIYAITTATTYDFNDWLNNVSSRGTIYNNGFVQLPTNSESGIPSGWTEITPPIESITANPDTFTIKSYTTSATCKSTLTITTTTGITNTRTNSATITVGENTGDSTRTLTETIPYKDSSYQVTIVQTANDVRPPISWNVVSEGTYPFQLNSNGYYESTNKGKGSSYSYATLNYSGFDELVLECINSGESQYDYGIISQPDVELSKSTTDDGTTGSTKVFKNFKGQSSTTPVQIVIPSDEGSHFITIKYIKDGSGNNGNDSLQFKVIEP